MKPLLRASVLAATVLVATVPARAAAGDALSPAERAALAARTESSLEAQRAGLGVKAGVSDAERELLAAAQAATPALQEQRAGFLVTDHDLVIVAWTLVIIAALIIIF